MRLSSTAGIIALAFTSLASAASQWTYTDGTLSVNEKGSEAVKQKLTAGAASPAIVQLPSSATLKVGLTTQHGTTGKRPHQAFLTLQDPASGLEESYAFGVKESGKAKLDIAHKDLPFQFLAADKPLKAFIVLGSFGTSVPFKEMAFDLNIKHDASAPPALPSPPERYASKEEIEHIFKDDPRSPPKVISFVFTLAILATVPVLLGAWVLLGANVDHVGKAFGANPIAHGLFLGSIVAMEFVFFLYYASWTLFQTLPVAGVVGIVAFISGSRALTEVQERRLTGQR